MSKPNFVRALVPYSFLSCSLSLDSFSSFSFVFLPNPWVLPPSSLVLPAFFPCSPSPSSFLPPYSFLLLSFFVLFFYNPSSQSFPPSLYLFYPSSVLLLPTFLLVSLSSCLLHPFLPPPSLPVLHLCCIVSSSHVFLLCSFVIVCVIVLCLGIIALCMSLQVVVLPFVHICSGAVILSNVRWLQSVRYMPQMYSCVFLSCCLFCYHVRNVRAQVSLVFKTTFRDKRITCLNFTAFPRVTQPWRCVVLVRRHLAQELR